MAQVAEHLDVHELHRSALVVVCDVSCRVPRGGCAREECTEADEIVLPRRGAFVRVAGRRASFADPSSVLFFGRGEAYRVSHPVDGGDDCTTLSFAPDVLAEALGRAGPRRGFPWAETTWGPAGLLGLQRLRARLLAGPPDPLEADELALQLLDGILAAAQRPEGPAPPRPATARAHREIAHHVRALVTRDLARRLSLADLAAAAGCSAFHLARLFAREVGLSVHRYRTRLRLGAALERLAEGQRDLSALALQLGFASHGHFSEAFRRELGRPPSSLRRELRAARPGRASRILEALP